MPTMANSLIPAPKDWNEFEEIVASCLRIRWKNKNISRIGRSGQAQHGVDIYGNDDSGRRAGVQCKLTEGNLNLNIIVDEVLKSEEFLPNLDIYYIATTARRDAKLQEKIHLLSEERKTMHKFTIQLLFWEDLIQDLTTDLPELNKHYPEISFKNRNNEDNKKAHISKKSFILFLVVLLIVLVYLIAPADITSALSSSSFILFEHKWGLILFFIFLAFVVTVLRISDSKFTEEREEHYRPKQIVSREKQPITTTVYDSDILDNRKWKVLREISIRNSTEYEIKGISGKVTFYDNDYKVDEVYFKEDIIPPRKGIRIEKLIEQKKQGNWDEFHTEIIIMEHDGKVAKNVKVFGIHLIRTYFFILNRYNYIRIFGKRILPYEITWLRMKSRDMWHRLMFMPFSWSATDGLNKGLFWIRIKRRIMQVAIILLLVCCVAYATGSFFIVIVKLVVFWYKSINLILK
ncbi:hypothetical protein [Paenibacillus oryzisoli]|uniref:Restriction endonuclease type IV Mrr domain-containing protein n=1 Tax=Paenibacillus oryzisoli TaxID=1850517 RepID=A0A198AQ62_9BACL|nr:hypothetical protein [Paenibacillus oryzisoli]OAS23684.1 hypothetical protein A8708_06095 [Paenibacillus oryzisoli]